MVSGYVHLAAALYQIVNGDDRYTKKGSMEFVVTDNARYKYDLRTIAEAVYRNIDQNRWNLYPGEPNWIYALCNLVGISGIVAGDKVLGTDYGDKLKSRFDAALASEYSNADGTILPIRSEITGFAIPGLAGAISDVAPAKENLRWSEDGRLELIKLVGADKINSGNYKSGQGFVRNSMASVASEYGDYKIRDELVRQMDEEHFPCFRAPILEDVPFPEVLVAKACSHDGKSVELVLYNGKQPGVFELGFKNMQPGKLYKLEGEVIKANERGEACFSVQVNGRTAVVLEPVAL
ncbi:hypothetical protein EJ07DRAFT_167723 [Lizonia empirigonia]|nr:hypothetical protein EJ07DRAFT_167723 [Lizonia empirigonia]